jgi:exosortase/archaeosortase family protein
VALSLVGCGVAVITQESLVRGLEAWTGADVARSVGLVPARAVGSAVVFPLRGHFVGYAVTDGCTVAFLVAPFFVIVAILIASRRTPPRRGLGALAALTVVLFTVNQARLFVVAASMRAWGFRSGYERSHVFLGTTLSTIGAVLGLLLFVRIVAKDSTPTHGPGARYVGGG